MIIFLNTVKKIWPHLTEMYYYPFFLSDVFCVYLETLQFRISTF